MLKTNQKNGKMTLSKQINKWNHYKMKGIKWDKEFKNSKKEEISILTRKFVSNVGKSILKKRISTGLVGLIE